MLYSHDQSCLRGVSSVRNSGHCRGEKYFKGNHYNASGLPAAAEATLSQPFWESELWPLKAAPTLPLRPQHIHNGLLRTASLDSGASSHHPSGCFQKTGGPLRQTGHVMESANAKLTSNGNTSEDLLHGCIPLHVQVYRRSLECLIGWPSALAPRLSPGSFRRTAHLTLPILTLGLHHGAPQARVPDPRKHHHGILQAGFS